MGVLSIWCSAHMANLVARIGLQSIVLVRTLNILCDLVRSHSFNKWLRHEQKLNMLTHIAQLQMVGVFLFLFSFL